MALLFADDFQQWATAGSTNMLGAGLYPQLAGQYAEAQQQEMLALGYYAPAACLGAGGINTRFPTIYYDTQKKNLCICQARYNQFSTLGASGLRRVFSYTGDVLYVGIVLELGGTLTPSGNFLFFGDKPENSVFTVNDGIGTNYLYTVGVNSSGFYTFNGTATTVQAYYKPATVKVYFDVVFTATTMELWINNVMALSQPRTAIALKELAITAGKLVTDDLNSVAIFAHSLMLADSTDGWSQRFGRRMAKTAPVATVATMESTLKAFGTPTPLAVIGKFATGPTVETDDVMLGSFVSSEPYVLNEFTGTIPTQSIVAALVNLQTKRMEPTNDGMGVLPFVAAGGQTTRGKVWIPSNTWKSIYAEVPVTPASLTAFNFGYTHDYIDNSQIYIGDRDAVRVYAEKKPVIPPNWWKSTDLIAYDSSVFVAGDFNDLNGKAIRVYSSTGESLPFKAGQSFKYGEGIDLGPSGCLMIAAGAIPQNSYSQPFTVDMWIKEGYNGTMSGLYPLNCYPFTTNNRLAAGPSDVQTTKMAVWNNAGPAVAVSTWDTYLSSTAWRHIAYVYNGSSLAVYVDGVSLGSVALTVVPFTSQFGLGKRAWGGPPAQVIVERYRMRSGAQWTSNFNPDTIYD